MLPACYLPLSKSLVKNPSCLEQKALSADQKSYRIRSCCCPWKIQGLRHLSAIAIHPTVAPGAAADCSRGSSWSSSTCTPGALLTPGLCPTQLQGPWADFPRIGMAQGSTHILRCVRGTRRDRPDPEMKAGLLCLPDRGLAVDSLLRSK